jgi:hypothetical protein
MNQVVSSLKKNPVTNDWILFVSSLSSNNLSRFTLGDSLGNAPTFIDNFILKPTAVEFRDITIVRDCEAIFGYGVYKQTNDIVKFTFENNDLTGNYENIETLPDVSALTIQPHGMSLPVGASDSSNERVVFLTDVTRGVIRVKFEGCSLASPGIFTSFAPPPAVFTQTRSFVVSLTGNPGLPDENLICKNVTVIECATGIENDNPEKISSANQLEFYDLSGKMILKSSPEQEQASLHQLQDGIYIEVYLKENNILSHREIFHACN